MARSKTNRHNRALPASQRNGQLSKAQQQALAILYDDVFMQPWFIPKEIYLAVRRLIPNIHLMKMRHYFDDYGCLKCRKTNALYGASGLCHSCNIIVRSRVMASLKKRLKKAHVKWEETASEHFFDQMNLAQLILYGKSAKGANSVRIRPSHLTE
jgi:hypothetical protein